MAIMQQTTKKKVNKFEFIQWRVDLKRKISVFLKLLKKVKSNVKRLSEVVMQDGDQGVLVF
jgi:hypothetical protein